MLTTLLLCFCLADDPFEYIPVMGPPNRELWELQDTNPEQFEQLTHVRLAGERWRFGCLHKSMETATGTVDRVNLNMGSCRELRSDLWATNDVSYGFMLPRMVFPVFERAYRFNRVVGGRVQLEDVSKSIPLQLLPMRGEACFRNGQIRNFARPPFTDYKIYVSFHAIGENRFEARSIWTSDKDTLWNLKPGRVIKVGDLLEIANGATLKVTRIVPPQTIKDVGNLVGWVCFEDVEHAAEERRKKNGEEPKTAGR
jgi:hypothetical protein